MGGDQRGSSLKTTLKVFNIIVSIILMIFGVFRYFNLQFSIDEPWIVFQPAYMILFGIILLLSELKIQFVIENLKFLSNYVGRGIFIIYLSTMVTGNLTGGDLMKYVSIIIAVFLLVTGILYIFIQCCCKDKIEEDEKKLLADEERGHSSSKDNQYNIH
ncbi:hypothetical protein ABPG72_004328 [Tetrahymena utriculariae]